ncbi:MULTISPECIES: caspase family protein [unclassified Bradyrhizobium]|uniref:caspase family protein n=1 Tax=unclassified Bradyrhizobium TaxID=2631580 RepID=UPI0029164EC1|nr:MULTISPECIES: caspase family protein [unclassified Bradyrhizobium]
MSATRLARLCLGVSLRPGAGSFCVASVIVLLVNLCGAAMGFDATVPTEIVVQSGHSEGTDVLSFSPNGTIIASGSSDGTVKLWTAERLFLLRTLRDGSGAVGAIAFTGDDRVVAGYRNGKLIAWDTATGRKLRELKHSGSVKALAVLSKDRVLSATQDGSVNIWDLSDGAIATVNHRANVHYSQLAVAPDRRSYAVVADNGTVAIGHLGRGNARIVRALTGVRSIGWSQQGTLLVATWTGELLGWNALTGRRLSWRTSALPVGIGAAPLFSSDGHYAIVGDNDGKLIIVNLTDLTRTEQHAHLDFVSALAFDAGGSRIVTTGNDDAMRIWSTDALKKLAEASVRPQPVEALATNQRNHLLVSGDFQGMLAVWDLRGGEKLRSLRIAQNSVTELTVGISQDGALASTSARGTGDDVTTSVWSLRGDATAAGAREWTSIGAMNPAGSVLATFGKMIIFWDVDTHKRLREAPGIGEVHVATFLPDGASIATAGTDNRIKFISAATGAVQRELRARTNAVAALAVSGDGRTLIVGGYDNRVEFWTLDPLQPLGMVTEHAQPVTAVAASKDGKLALSASRDGTVKTWDVLHGQRLSEFTGHTSNVLSVAFVADEHFAASAGLDGAIRIWDPRTGKEIAAFVSGSAEDWIAITPAGFFREPNRRSVAPIHIVHGFDVTTIEQVRQSLFNPDLVREALDGDPDGEITRAATSANIDDVLASGPAPEVSIQVPESDDNSAPGVITAEATIIDRGRGVGRIEWRVNGITTAVRAGPEGNGPRYRIKQLLALDPGDNVVELVAYNGSNVLASLPARTTLNWQGGASTKGRLHVLAIGVNAYDDTLFKRLNNAVNDAQALGKAFEAAAGGMYDAVDVEYALDEEATPTKLDKLIDRMAARIGPRDTFVFFAAAHGTSENGRFYLIPYGFRTDATPLSEKAIGQDRLQDWIGNRIKARRALLLLDTCASGALVSSYALSRTRAPASEAAVGRLHEAIGRPVLTAAASGQAALEGYQKHGLFTWAILDALKHGDRNGNGLIEVSELAAYVQSLTPDLSETVDRQQLPSLEEARGALAMMQTRIELRSGYRQSARLGSEGEDFSLVEQISRDVSAK